LDTRLKSEAFRTFAQTAGRVANPEVEKWKAGGGKIVGYFCSALPEEMISAAGMFPFRLRATGSTETDLSDSFLSSLNCTFPRHAFNMALKGDYDFIDALVMFNSCDHIRRVYDHWIRQLKTPFVRILSLPRKAEPAQVEFFRGELAGLREGLQDHFGVEITDAGLREAIRLHNETRGLLRDLYALRKGKNPPITGAETLAVTVSSTAMPQERYNALLRELLEDIEQAERVSDYRARLMLLGGELDNPDYVKAIEDQGALVVADSLCFGSRLLWKDVNEDAEDPLLALAQYYVADRPACARMFTEYEGRSRYIREMIDQFDVEGAVFERLKFCEVWGFEQFSLTNDFEKWNIPLLCMEREYPMSAVGQLKTRVQAFLEMLES
jgi:benzoyl-CoA reductase/2-hydroxyglutaryl-CoA dehydratase subunit BcrC/BadD/HgdB